MRFTAALTLLAGVALPAAAQYTTCAWSSAPGVSWDLTPLMRPGAAGYAVSDVRDPSTVYFFDVCDGVLPPAAMNATCTAPSGTGFSPRPQNQFAATSWQFETNTSCYRLGQAASAGWNFSVFDPAYPARGVVLSYKGGDSDWCPYGPSGRAKRSMSLELICSATAGAAIQEQNVTVREENDCDYRVQIPSLLGCPTQCLTGFSVCSGNGVCGYNTDAARAQCFCYAGWTGPFCGSTPAGSGGMSAEGVILIIVCLVLAAVIALVIFMALKLRRLTVDPSAYGELQGKFNELGQLA